MMIPSNVPCIRLVQHVSKRSTARGNAFSSVGFLPWPIASGHYFFSLTTTTTVPIVGYGSHDVRLTMDSKKNIKTP